MGELLIDFRPRKKGIPFVGAVHSQRERPRLRAGASARRTLCLGTTYEKAQDGGTENYAKKQFHRVNHKKGCGSLQQSNDCASVQNWRPA
jgi:hypothetical protein